MTKETHKRTQKSRLDLESHKLLMSISGLFNYCNAVASLLHLAEQINELH